MFPDKMQIANIITDLKREINTVFLLTDERSYFSFPQCLKLDTFAKKKKEYIIEWVYEFQTNRSTALEILEIIKITAAGWKTQYKYLLIKKKGFDSVDHAIWISTFQARTVLEHNTKLSSWFC